MVHQFFCGVRYHQDLYYEEDEDSEFETLAIPSDEEIRHINEVPVQKTTKKGNSSSNVAMTHKPKLPPKPKWNPAMDISQINNGDEHLRKRTQTFEKKEITTSIPAVKSNEKPTLPKQLSLQPQKMVAHQKDTNGHKSDSGTLSHPTCSNPPSLLNNLYQPSNLSNLKIVDDSSTPSSPDIGTKKNVELIPFAKNTDKSTSPDTTERNTTPLADNSAKEDRDMFKSLSIDSGEREVISDGEDDVMEEDHNEKIVDLPEGDEETAKGKLE